MQRRDAGLELAQTPCRFQGLRLVGLGVSFRCGNFDGCGSVSRDRIDPTFITYQACLRLLWLLRPPLLGRSSTEYLSQPLSA